MLAEATLDDTNGHLVGQDGNVIGHVIENSTIIDAQGAVVGELEDNALK